MTAVFSQMPWKNYDGNGEFLQMKVELIQAPPRKKLRLKFKMTWQNKVFLKIPLLPKV